MILALCYVYSPVNVMHSGKKSSSFCSFSVLYRFLKDITCVHGRSIKMHGVNGLLDLRNLRRIYPKGYDIFPCLLQARNVNGAII